MMQSHLFYTLPVGAAAILAEWFFFNRRFNRAYPWAESAVSLAIAIPRRMAHAASHLGLAGVYLWCWDHRFFTVPLHTAGGVAGLFLGSEFFYYWEHRLSHTTRWFWATHSVHHSPNELTLSSAFRLGWTGPISGAFVFHLPMIVLGFHPLAVTGALSANLLYQFWLHTQLVPRLGWFDKVFNSPSNHRVHHASNPEYIDRNFGGVLVVFDHLFGTYVGERDGITFRYGLVHPQTSNNPLVVALGEWKTLFKDAVRARSLGRLLRTLWGPPAEHERGGPTRPLPAPSPAAPHAARPCP